MQLFVEGLLHLAEITGLTCADKLGRCWTVAVPRLRKVEGLACWIAQLYNTCDLIMRLELDQLHLLISGNLQKAKVVRLIRPANSFMRIRCRCPARPAVGFNVGSVLSVCPFVH